MMTIGSSLHKIDRIEILKIVQGKACDIRKDFEIRLNSTAQRTQVYYMNKIIELDPIVTRTFHGGCTFF